MSKLCGSARENHQERDREVEDRVREAFQARNIAPTPHMPFPFSIFSFTRGKSVDGAKPTVFLASSPEVDGASGAFFNNKGVRVKPSTVTYDEAVAKRLW